ncbi:MAG: MBL fold metallo-hydrolase [Cyanobacteria bacterium]|nr:MBL fold metallo-hydrolase [Cyanobacteriota bacterium]
MSLTELLTSEQLTLEDHYGDVIRKAMRGLNITVSDLAVRAQIDENDVHALLDGAVDSLVLSKCAFVLHLHAPSLIQLAEEKWAPHPVEPMPGFAMSTTWYGDMTVNAYIVWDLETKKAATFDTGSSCQPLLEIARNENLCIERVFITHIHQDHLADLPLLLSETRARGFGSLVDNPLSLSPLKHGDGLILGSLTIRVLQTSGHTPGGLSYYIEGLEKPLVIVGDSLFAASQGGAPAHAYQEALRNNRDNILSLPKQTIICPGHGLLTTVEEERAHNPFFPELK